MTSFSSFSFYFSSSNKNKIVTQVFLFLSCLVCPFSNYYHKKSLSVWQLFIVVFSQNDSTCNNSTSGTNDVEELNGNILFLLCFTLKAPSPFPRVKKKLPSRTRQVHMARCCCKRLFKKYTRQKENNINEMRLIAPFSHSSFITEEQKRKKDEQDEWVPLNIIKWCCVFPLLSLSLSFFSL